MTLEKHRLKIGIVPLSDCATIVAAKERGFFAEQGLEVEITREASWANIRDKVSVGTLDAAQMLAPMPLTATLGLGNWREHIITALGLNVGGNAITVSNALYERMLSADPAAMLERPVSARALKAVIEEDRQAGRPPMTFASVYPFSTHNYELRYWMAAAGIDPDRDVRLVVVPPPQMVANLSAGNIVGYCVGEPWNTLAVSLGLGHALIDSRQLGGGRVEKVLGVRQAWADAHPRTFRALLKAMLQAAQWADALENRRELAQLLAQPCYVNTPVEVIRPSLETPGRISFFSQCATFPWRSQALWYLTQMNRWRSLPPNTDLRRVAESVYRTDLYRMAALELGLAVPLTDLKPEGTHAEPWVLTDATAPIAMGADIFLDGAVFDPERLDDALASFTRPSLTAEH